MFRGTIRLFEHTFVGAIETLETEFISWLWRLSNSIDGGGGLTLSNRGCWAYTLKFSTQSVSEHMRRLMCDQSLSRRAIPGIS